MIISFCLLAVCSSDHAFKHVLSFVPREKLTKNEGDLGSQVLPQIIARVRQSPGESSAPASGSVFASWEMATPRYKSDDVV